MYILFTTGANISLRDPVREFTTLEWAELCGRKACIELLRSHIKTNNTGKSSKRLSQTLNETENWLRKRFGNMYSTTPASSSSTSSDLVARSTASSTLCVSLPVLTGVSVSNDNQQGNNGASTCTSGEGDGKITFSIPMICVTPEYI